MKKIQIQQKWKRKFSDEKINETSSLWYNLFDEIYILYNKNKDDKKLELIIQSTIKSILNKMCLFVSITYIIQIVKKLWKFVKIIKSY